MKKITQIGVIMLAIGLALLVATIYRSTATLGFGHGNLLGLPPNMWNSEGHVGSSYFWPPREVRLDAKCNSTIDLYILDSEGIRSWILDGTLKPVWSAKGTSQDIFTVQINNRGTYAFLSYNPTNMTTIYDISATIYGHEKDLLWASIAFILSGLTISLVSLLMLRNPKTKQVK